MEVFQMAVNNSLSKQAPKFSVAIQQDGYKNLINNTLGDPKRAARFIGAITSAVSANPALQECDPGTILSAGLLGESLNLSPSPQLGQTSKDKPLKKARTRE
jgi:recombination protein RecT